MATTVKTDRGHYTTLTDFLSAYPRPEVQPVLPPVRKTNSYSSRRICRLLNQPEEDWSTDEKAFLTHLLTENESVQQVHTLRKQFQNLMNRIRYAVAGRSEKNLLMDLPNGVIKRNNYLLMEGLYVVYGRIMLLLSKHGPPSRFSSEWSNGQTEEQPGCRSSKSRFPAGTKNVEAADVWASRLRFVADKGLA